MSIEFSVVFMRGYSFGQDMAQEAHPQISGESSDFYNESRIAVEVLISSHCTLN